ncbi:MAG: NlpC/P60 family protein [Armatimonadota bacterium]|nr:NlpC/P60 family protein [Armatimonadota bacterium]MDW8024732.1 NlpC/P60 family protein [Armatimonadota bacterium]
MVYKLHTVQHGETLKSIASQYGITVEQLCAANKGIGISEDMPLASGKTLIVPLPLHSGEMAITKKGESQDSSTNHSNQTKVNAFWIYEAKDGETLEMIAKNFKVPIKILCDANKHIVAKENLKSGMTVLVPIIIGVEGNIDRKAQSNSNLRQIDGKKVNNNANTNEVNISNIARENLPHYSRKVSPISNLQTFSRDFAIVGVVKVRSAIYSAPSKNSTRYYTCQPGRKLVVVGRKSGWLGVLMINGAIGWMQENAVTLTDRRVSFTDVQYTSFGGVTRFMSSIHNSLGYAIVNEAMRYLNVPYKYGGNSINGIDCSALVQKVYRTFGIKLPRTATEQLRYGVPINLSQIQPGDRVYFSNNGVRANHCGIYIGDGKFIHASGRHGKVTISSLYEPRYFKNLLCVLR